MLWRFAALTVLLTAWTAASKEWCDVGADHTMCKWRKPSSECASKTIKKGLSPEAVQAVLDKHNQLRRKVAKGNEAGQPKAANMRKIVYSEDLAIVAQRWADQCTFGHDKNRKRCDGTYVGQNAYTNGWWSSGRSSQDTFTEAMVAATQAWYDEVTTPGWTGGAGSPFTMDHAKSGCLHYTQVVWAESDELGCGAVQYNEDAGWKHNLIICNYAKGGNIIGRTMYEEGEPASNCPTGFSADDGLCSKDSNYSTEECDGNGDGIGGTSGNKPSGGEKTNKGEKPSNGGKKKSSKGKKSKLSGGKPKPNKGKKSKGKGKKRNKGKKKPSTGKQPKKG